MGPKIKRCLERGQKVLPDMPTRPSDVNSVEMDLYCEDIHYYIKTKHQITQELEQAYNIVIGQYTPLMIQRLEGMDVFPAIKDNQNIIKLL